MWKQLIYEDTVCSSIRQVFTDDITYVCFIVGVLGDLLIFKWDVLSRKYGVTFILVLATPLPLPAALATHVKLHLLPPTPRVNLLQYSSLGQLSQNEGTQKTPYSAKKGSCTTFDNNVDRATDKMHKINFNWHCLRFFITKFYVLPLVRIISRRRF